MELDFISCQFLCLDSQQPFTEREASLLKEARFLVTLQGPSGQLKFPHPHPGELHAYVQTLIFLMCLHSGVDSPLWLFEVPAPKWAGSSLEVHVCLPALGSAA